ncbi:peptide-methionine (S)-S-oxide reductase MsrA [Shewanella sp. NIFS-20-20]|uniref:peptide-methionine (S)-S-oxide reductase MsrA n=1 Tax=Shewanella sp. NIFS-20-20 TaxID=2853806 RepID=UPI001C48E5B3|nr:peptide-methionine (S)-S-oxide reductase MsrA [Shewanella sp. NIFS-20-20]MBV7315204.1 peptide-methionine (S)-S-oxide reductase MsrA [Shewanella sp. NIFS-20-20]
MAIATFGAGCFWGVEYFFKQLDGVITTQCGYMGGGVDNPSYQQVKTGTSGHAEVVQLEFDPQKISYEQLLKVFWANHNPTSLNQQGGDIGSQYRSVVFFHDRDQKERAQHSKLALMKSGRWGQRHIVTEIVPALTFFRAEEYHQNYLENNNLPSCHLYYGE